MRGATAAGDKLTGGDSISIHAPRAGCDQDACAGVDQHRVFQSTHPVRGATLREAVEKQTEYISIHAPRAGCDDGGPGFSPSICYFNPRTPCGVRPGRHAADWASPRHFNPRTPCGVRLKGGVGKTVTAVFQSTHPVRGATLVLPDDGRQIEFQSTHPVRGATIWPRRWPQSFQFQSTHPVRGATLLQLVADGKIDISIHAPRAGCDWWWPCLSCPGLNFNPRTPCGVRLKGGVGKTVTAVFQSTHPVRGATRATMASIHSLGISIHAPRAGCDSKTYSPTSSGFSFQSTHPVRGATGLYSAGGQS